MQAAIHRLATLIRIEAASASTSLKGNSTNNQWSSAMCDGALPDHSGHKIQRVSRVIFTVPKTA
jgi:hypothetical protein